MIVHVARRGHSFKGAGLYYLHDKGASTTERVAWTHTHNLPTDDPDKALKWMAHTSKGSDRLKAEAGIAKTGRKASAGCVYAFALSWHPEQKPEKDHMLNAALTTLERLGLKEHEAVLVAHQDTNHPHVHVICNLISPKNGRTAVPSYDRLSLSKWAEEYEKEDGKIYCEERVKNNQERQEKAKEDRQLGMVKHREEKLDCAAQVQELYNQSDSGKSFQAALNEAGFTLAQGDRRGFVIVDPYGKIHSLSRQLQGQRAQDIKARLSDIDHALLPQAKAVMEERQYFDRDKYEVEWQIKTVDAAIEGEQRNGAAERPNAKEGRTAPPTEREANVPAYDAHLVELDKRRDWEANMQSRRHALEKLLAKTYGREEKTERLRELETLLSKNVGILGKLSGKKKQFEAELEALKMTIENIDMRAAEQWGALEAEIEKSRVELFPTEAEKLERNIKQEKEREQEAFKRRVQHQIELNNMARERDKGYEFER